ncbi:MAG: histidine kinase [Opitutae bacterium]|nr:histidine kinase [Opitutae bacterium]
MPEYRRLNWRFVFGLWTGLGLLLVFQTYVATAGEHWTGMEHVTSWVSQFLRAWIWAALTPFVFALRRELIARRTPRAGEVALHVLAALAILAFGNVLRIWLIEILFGYWELRYFGLQSVFSMFTSFTLIDFYIYWVVLGAGYVTDLGWQKRQTELRAEQLRTQLSQAELAALKQQVQPHFLFNALNAISASLREGELAKGVEAIARLSTLLRQLMANAGQPEIELWRELDYARCYLDVEAVRFEDRLITHFDADEDCLPALVPTLLLQPIVENAIKHGIAQRCSPGRVAVTAHRAGETLVLRVTNDPAEGGRRAREQDNHGIGLAATRARLERAFGDRHKFESEIDGPAGTVITLEIPLRFTPAADG